MSKDTPSTELANNAFRFSVLGFFTRGYTNKVHEIRDANGNETAVFEDKYGLVSAKMKMPDGSIEYWRQTDLKVNAHTGFRANAFERCNADGSVYLQDGHKPQVMMVFPGNTGDKQDRDTTGRVLSGGNLEHIYKNADEFTDDYMRRLDERASRSGHEKPSVVIVSHSIGNNALASALHMREKGFDVSQTILYEPVGAGQALQQLVPREAHRLYGDNPTDGQRGLVTAALTHKVFSIRNDDDDMFQQLGGNDAYDNAMLGEVYHYKSDTHPYGPGYINDHMLEPLGISLQKHKGNALTRARAEELPATDIVHGGRPLAPGELIWASAKGVAFDKAGPLMALFAEAAALEQHQNPNDRRPDFNDLKLPGVSDFAPDLSAMPQIKIVGAPTR